MIPDADALPNNAQQTGFSHLQPPSLTQTIAFSILNAWGHDGFNTHTLAVSQFYREKRDVFETAMKKHLDGLAEWVAPEAGMFFWYVVLHIAGLLPLSAQSLDNSRPAPGLCPSYRDTFLTALLTFVALCVPRFKLLIGTDTDEGDSESIIRTKAVERGVLALPGTVFFPGGQKTAYVRASFSLNTPEEVDEALRRLRLVVLDARAALS